MNSQNPEVRRLSTGDWIVFDRSDRTLYLIKAERGAEVTSNIDELRRLVETGDALAIDRKTLNALYEEFTRIAVLV